MENGLDLTLKLGLPNPSVVETKLSLSTSTTTDDQGTNLVVDGGQGDNNNNNGGDVFNVHRALWRDDEVVDDDEGARNNVDINLRVYQRIFKLFAGAPNTLNFDPYPMPLSPAVPAPAPMTLPASDGYVLIDVPARRAQRNNTLLMANARNESPNAYAKRLRGCGGCCGGRIGWTRKCTNLNCNALTTPMWRSGPLGPKSLCNACGIKYRKEQERKSKMN